ncbi:Thiol-disulfide oxidoreductase ResA [Novipirellula aureliae]|uniref:Thiol-disulfide oxidoreductase ResA n=1 Tax=Novipirellula aureliae TaxID=2527966 RepID=A0A5C6E832_9BACT|nr:TlpA family protein disulfide reductase [Novipirellula aureliae]TWU44978.1 Thiol-disulfide oxidoreductase ResA [Novipirellula aureliae]
MMTKLFLVLISFLSFGVDAYAESEVEEGSSQKPSADVITCSVRGTVHMPDELSEEINTEGLSLRSAIVTLEGKYSHPRMPYPPEWSTMTPEERSDWHNAFMNSDGYDAYLREVEVARAKRKVYKTELAEDGTFVFEDVIPAWYQLTTVIMHPDAGKERSLELARAYAMRQFFVKEAEASSPMNLTLKVKNVLTPGDLAPDWTATAYDGSEFKLADFRGKFVLFDFWATWCGPCRAEFPNLEAVYEDFGGERLEMIGLSVDKAISEPQSLFDESPSAYRQGWVGDTERHERIFEAYGIQEIPSIWLIGPDGKIVARDLRGKSLHESVKAALAAESVKD